VPALAELIATDHPIITILIGPVATPNAPTRKWDNRPSWDNWGNDGNPWDNRKTWDNWDNRNWDNGKKK
jgi:uncharacterized protein YraI